MHTASVRAEPPPPPLDREQHQNKDCTKGEGERDTAKLSYSSSFLSRSSSSSFSFLLLRPTCRQKPSISSYTRSSSLYSTLSSPASKLTQKQKPSSSSSAPAIHPPTHPPTHPPPPPLRMKLLPALRIILQKRRRRELLAILIRKPLQHIAVLLRANRIYEAERPTQERREADAKHGPVGERGGGWVGRVDERKQVITRI